VGGGIKFDCKNEMIYNFQIIKQFKMSSTSSTTVTNAAESIICSKGFKTPLNADVDTFNDRLVTSQRRVDIHSYYDKALVDLFKIDTEIYKKEFASQFLSWVDTPDEFCIPHSELSNYGVLSDKIKDKDSSRAKKFFNDTHSYVEGVDYIIIEEVVNNGLRGQATKKTYMMTPDVFKMCLMRCKNTRKYADYYLILEKVFVYYHRYEKAYLNFLCSGKDDKIDNLTMEIKEQSRKMDEQTLQINALLGYATDAKEDAKVAKADAEVIKEKLDDAHDRLDVQDAKIDTIKDLLLETSDNSIVPFEKEKKRAEFVLLRSKDDQTKFKFIRGKKAYNDTKLRKEYGDKYDIIRREYDANPGHLFCLFRETVRTEMVQTRKEIRESKTMTKSDKDTVLSTLEKIRFNNTCITLLNDYTADELYAKIDNVFQKKYMNYHSSCEDDSSE
jgi:hypothetical protein